MNRLKEELRRLNLLLEGDPANGTVTRIIVLGFTRAADWAAAARLHRSVQEAFEFPPPLVSIVAGGGYREQRYWSETGWAWRLCKVCRARGQR